MLEGRLVGAFESEEVGRLEEGDTLVEVVIRDEVEVDAVAELVVPAL